MKVSTRLRRQKRFMRWEERWWPFRVLYHGWLRWQHGRSSAYAQRHVITIAREDFIDLRSILLKHVVVSGPCSRELGEHGTRHYAYILGYNP